MTHVCVSKLTIIGSDNGLSPGRCQCIFWTNDKVLLNGPLKTKFGEILIEIHSFSFRKVHLKMSSKNGGYFNSLSILQWIVLQTTDLLWSWQVCIILIWILSSTLPLIKSICLIPLTVGKYIKNWHTGVTQKVKWYDHGPASCIQYNRP